MLLNSEPERKDFVVETSLKDTNGTIASQVTESIKMIDKSSTVSVSLSIDNPHLWHGRKDPYLYTSCTRLIHGLDVLDEINISVGCALGRNVR